VHYEKKTIIRIQSLLLALLLFSYSLHSQINTEKWKIFETSLEGPATGNPFKEVQLTCKFSKD